MRDFLRLRNPIMPYAWGSRTAIRAIAGRAGAADTPQAELWMGAHPKAPSEVWVDGQWVSLERLIADDPVSLLGADVAERFDGTLPFLMKILAAAAPLSIQAHPDAEQAAAGFQREEALGIPRDAPHRNYRDAGHKPELIVALEPFTIMRGFRQPTAIAERLDRLGVRGDLASASGLADGPEGGTNGGLKALLAEALALDPATSRRLIETAIANHDPDDLADRWLVRLADAYPGDPGVLSPIWLQVRVLQPGEAAFTGPGILHAYLDGTGIEIMSSSDNVLRGGLTPKHVDQDELMSILRFEPAGDGHVAPTETGRTRTWNVPADEFVLSAVELDDAPLVRSGRSSIEVLLVTVGYTVIETDTYTTLVVAGNAILIRASVGDYRLRGTGTVFIAGVPRA